MVNKTMVVKNSKCDIVSIRRLQNYLYELEGSNYELLEIYEDIDEELCDFINETVDDAIKLEQIERELKDMKKDINDLIANAKILLKEEVIEELERIMF